MSKNFEDLVFDAVILDGREVVLLGQDPEDDNAIIYVTSEGEVDYFLCDEYDDILNSKTGTLTFRRQ